MQHLLSLSYWFNLRPETLSPLGQKLFSILLLLFLMAVILILATKNKSGLYRGFLKRISNFCVGNIIIGSILLFFNYEIIPFFSARFWLAIWGVIMAIWLYFIFKSLKKIKAIKNEKGRLDEFKKYLP